MSGSYASARRATNHPETASWLRRVGALFVDWLACDLVAFFILRDVQHPAFGAVSLIIFWLESAVGVALGGSSFGQRSIRRGQRGWNVQPLGGSAMFGGCPSIATRDFRG